MFTTGKIVLSAAIILSTAFALATSSAFANAPGGAYIQCDGGNRRPSAVRRMVGSRANAINSARVNPGAYSPGMPGRDESGPQSQICAFVSSKYTNLP